MGDITIRRDLKTRLIGDAYVQLRTQQVAEEVAATARAIAAAEAYETGRYMAGITVMGQKVVATDWKSAWIEWGNVNRPATHTLKRAAEVNGYKVVGNKGR